MKLPAFEDLSKEQDAIYNLDLDGNYLVSGPPGTGKSVMALYRAQALSIDERTPSVLMYNNALQQYTEQAAQEIEVDGYITTLHKWMWRFWKTHYHSNPPVLQANPYVHDWDEIAMRFVSQPPSGASLNELVVDEGQDLPPGFYRLARFLSQNITVFADENQRLWDLNTTIEEIRRSIAPKEHMELRRNYRNSAEIAAVAATFYCGSPTGIPDPPQRHGERPTLRAFGKMNDFVEHVATYATSRSHLSIGVACPTGSVQKKLFNRLSSRNLGLPVQTYISNDKEHSKLDFTQPAITLVHYKSLKGLEFDTLFVPELQAVAGDPSSAALRMTFYVVASRARNELHLSWTGEGGVPPIVDKLGKLVEEL